MKTPDRKIKIMGILNLNEDSYFEPSRYNYSIIDSQADIIDIGAVSTRPGAALVNVDEEWARLEPVLKSLSGVQTGKEISIDTTSAEIIRRSCDTLGTAVIANDISAGEDDPDMLATVGELGLSYIAMHKRGTPSTMQTLCTYDNVVSDIVGYFERFGQRAKQFGVKEWIIDPGFGFAKTVDQNYELMLGLEKFSESGRQVLVGISRKSFMYKPLSISAKDALCATQAMHMAALERGADILRVHDVEAAAQTVKLYRLLHGVESYSTI